MALIGLEVGAPMVFVSSDIQYVKWKNGSDTCFTAASFCFPGSTRGCPSAGEFFGHGSNGGPRSI